jgi:hypothetical protein
LPGVARGRRWDDGTAEVPEGEHITLDLRASLAARGTGGSGGAERSSAGFEALPAKGFSAAQASESEGAPALALAGPSREEVAMPARSSTSSDLAPGVIAGGNVVLEERASIAHRSGAAPALGIDSPSTSSSASRARSAASSAIAGAPARPASVGVDGPQDMPLGGAIVDAPIAAEESAPSRVAASIDPKEAGKAAGSGTSSVPIALASPSESPQRMSQAARGVSLDALAAANSAPVRNERASADLPRFHAASASNGASEDALSVPSSSAVDAPAPSGADAFSSSGAASGTNVSRAALDAEPSAAIGAKIGLSDGENTRKRGDSRRSVGANGPGESNGANAANGAGASGANGSGESNGPGGSGGSGGDLVDSLASAANGMPDARAGSSAAPLEKKSFAHDTTEAAAAPHALALDPPDERPRIDPPPPSKSWENTPYKNREGEDKARALTLNGGTRETEAAVAKGLAYLASVQQPSGAWGSYEELDDKYGQFAIGKTGLALLAFLGAGHTHLSHTQHSDNVMRALAFLIALQDPASGHFGSSEAYSHGIATYALAECYALTGETELRAPLERAVAHILAKQNHASDPRLFGGWSYYYKDDRVYDRWPRTSITVWQVMALESARLAGVRVPEKVFDDAAAFIRNAEDEDNGWFRYNHDPARLSSNWPTLPASTPAALFALSLVGDDIESDAFARSREFVLSRAPREYRRGSDDDFVRRGQGNLYFWYYGTLAMFRAGGNAWQRWNAGMKNALVRGQRKDGSWTPIDLYSSYARDDEHDRSYSTAMCVLSLEVYYRYYLPLLKVR